jgi:signal transduction histidine kinase
MALLNLVTNALDAMPGGGSLSITAVATPDRIRVEVADTGAGIPLQIIDRLFEPWVTTKPRGQGTGLGLAIVRDVVRAWRIDRRAQRPHRRRLRHRAAGERLTYDVS